MESQNKKEDTEKLIKKITKDCKWKKDMYGIDLCTGLCSPCKRIIEIGKCPTLIDLFGKEGE